MQFTWKFQEGDVIILFIDFPAAGLAGTETELQRIAANTKAALLKNYPQGKAIDEKFFNLGEFPAVKTSLEVTQLG